METTKLIIDTLSAVLVPIIAILTAYIAYQQYRTNKNRLRFELYDKRFEIYLSIKTFISYIVSKADVDIDRAFQFLRETREAEFLFDKEILEYTDEMYKKALKIHAIVASYESLPTGDRRTELVNEQLSLVTWFSSQVEIASKKFSKYLSLKDLN
ncbi:MAG: hypothetical protein AB1598_01160 [Thermodesulfobacteriota bacterium]